MVLIEIGTLMSCTVLNLDGEPGKIRDIYFDDNHWKMHHLIVNSNKWLNNNSRFSIAPDDIEGIDSTNSVIFTSLTSEKMKKSPSDKLDMQISNKNKREKKKSRTEPEETSGPERGQKTTNEKNIADSPNNILQSTKEIFGYKVQTLDKRIGSLKDLTADNKNWMYRHLVVSGKHLAKAQRIMVPVSSVRNINVKKKQITVDLPLNEIQSTQAIETASQLDVR
jgi:sporulation protein YlmC with PRC-barrel domain